MKKISEFLFQSGYYVILSVASLIFAYLSIHIFFSHTYIPLKISEQVQFFANPWGFYPLLLLFFFICLLIRPLLDKLKEKQLFLAFTALYFLAGIYLLFNVPGIIRADAKHVFTAAQAFNQGDYSSLTLVGAYMYRNPHQLGLMTLERLYSLISPTTHFAFIINWLLIILTNLLIYKITARLVKNPLVSKYTILFAFLFFPQFFFILFIYGTIPGLFCCLASLYAFICFDEKGKFSYLFLGAVSIGLACLLRNNYIIFALMLVGVQTLSILKTWSWKKLLAPILTLACVLTFAKAVNHYYEGVIGRPIGEGTPKIAYVTMGLRDDPDRRTIGGWYDAYNTKILKRNKYDEAAATKMATEDLHRLVVNFLKKPDYAVKFFSEKIRSTWTEPTFQSIWTGPQIERQQYTKTRLLQSIYQEGNAYRMLNFLELVFLAFVYLTSTGFVIYKLFSPRQQLSSYQLYALIFFIGGFTFHIFWETKSQYVYPYVLLLLPLAAQFMVALSSRIEQVILKKQRKTSESSD